MIDYIQSHLESFVYQIILQRDTTEKLKYDCKYLLNFDDLDLGLKEQIIDKHKHKHKHKHKLKFDLLEEIYDKDLWYKLFDDELVTFNWDNIVNFYQNLVIHEKEEGTDAKYKVESLNSLVNKLNDGKLLSILNKDGWDNLQYHFDIKEFVRFIIGHSPIEQVSIERMLRSGLTITEDIVLKDVPQNHLLPLIQHGYIKFNTDNFSYLESLSSEDFLHLKLLEVADELDKNEAVQDIVFDVAETVYLSRSEHFNSEQKSVFVLSLFSEVEFEDESPEILEELINPILQAKQVVIEEGILQSLLETDINIELKLSLITSQITSLSESIIRAYLDDLGSEYTKFKRSLSQFYIKQSDVNKRLVDALEKSNKVVSSSKIDKGQIKVNTKKVKL